MREFRKPRTYKLPPKTKKQIEASRKSGLKTAIIHLHKHKFKKGQPAWNKNKETLERTKIKLSDKLKGRVSGFKGKRHTKEAKIKNAIKHTGKKGSPKSRENLIKILIFNQPMNNPELVKKGAEKRMLKLNEDLLGVIIEEFNEGKSISQLAKESKVDPGALSRLLKRSGVNVNKSERIALYNKSNPNIIEKQLKKGHMSSGCFKKGHKPWNKKEVLENEKDSNTIITSNNTIIN